MALPLVALGTLARGAGTAIANSTPEQRRRILNYISKATGGAVNTVEQAVGFAAKSQGGLSVVAMNAAKAGLNPDLMFSQNILGSIRQEEANALLENLRNVYNSEVALIDSKAAIQGQGGLADEIFEIGMIKIWENRLGIRSPEESRKFHVAAKIVENMSEARFAELQALRGAL